VNAELGPQVPAFQGQSSESGQVELDKIKNYFEYDGSAREEPETQEEAANSQGFDVDLLNDGEPSPANDGNEGYRSRKLHQQRSTKAANREKEANSTKESGKKHKRQVSYCNWDPFN